MVWSNAATVSIDAQGTRYELSPMDTVMTAFGLAFVTIFPPRHDGQPYDQERLQASFESLVEEDYPVLMGRLQVDEKTGVVSVWQSTDALEQSAKSIPFVTETWEQLTTEDAMRSTPYSLVKRRDASKEMFTVKTTILADGGLAIGVSLSHTLLDGEAFFAFMKTWGMHYRGVQNEDRASISHDRHLLAPRGTLPTLEHPEFVLPNPLTKNDLPAQDSYPVSTQRLFHITPEQMERLKTLATSPWGEYVSTVDAVTALFTILISQARGHGQNIKITTGVNARRRLNPPLPKNYAGNVIFNALSAHPAEDLSTTSQEALRRIALRIRRSILARDDAYLRDAIDYVAAQGDKATSIQVGTDCFFGNDITFSSWINMGMYDADFGAKPWYCGQPKLDLCDGFVVVMEGIHETPGLDVMVFLECKAMDRLVVLWEACDLF